MKTLILASAAMMVSVVAAASNTVIMLSPEAKFSNPDGVSASIRADCNLTTKQVEAVRREAISLGIPVSVSSTDEIPATGRYVQIRIEGAYSSGHAFVGHSKEVSSSATLYDSGQKIATIVFSRDSSGGIAANFKNSCSVLERCTDKLGVDIAKWIKKQVKNH